MEIEQSRLENGLTVVTARMPGFVSAGVAAVINAGARYETEVNNGIAHFLEHMAFKGTRSRSAAQIAMEVELLGSSTNATTSHEIVCYVAWGLRTTIAKSLTILGDVVANSVFAESDISTERGVILQEIKRAEDSPARRAGRGFRITAYPAQSVGRPILGGAEFIRNAKRADFIDFRDAHYHTSNVTVVAAADIGHREFRGMVADHFSALQRRADRIEPEPAQWIGGFYSDTSPAFEQVHIYLGLPSVPFAHPARHQRGMMAAAFGFGRSSPLFQEVREKRGLVYSTNVHAQSGRDHGEIQIYGATTPDNVDEFLKVVCDLLTRAGELITEDDITRARNTALTALSTVMETPSNLALWLAAFAGVGELFDPEVEWRKIEAVTIDQVRATAQDILSKPPTLSMVGPIDVSRDYYAMVCDALGTPRPSRA